MPNIIIHNAKVCTLDGPPGFATAIAIREDHVLAVGSDEKIFKWRRPHTRFVDAGGRLIIPGLTDAHVHFSMYAHFRQNINAEQPTKQAVLDLVAERAASTPPGTWITGHGWAQDNWPDRQFPTAADLDAVTTTHPVFLRAKSGHAAWVNSLALKIGGITASTADPDGGQIQRDTAGQPTGILFEAPADRLVSEHIPDPTPDELVAMIRDTQRYAWSVGLTGIHCFDGYDAFVAYQNLREHDELGLRVWKTIPVEVFEHALALGLRSGFGNRWLRVGGVKVFLDGALGPRTAAMIAPYEGEPGNLGITITDKEQLYEVASRATAHGLSMTVHAIGDRANHDLLDVYETIRADEAARGIPRSARRHRAEHVQLLHPDDLGRLGQLDIIASMQPLHATSDMRMAEDYWGDRHRYAYGLQTQRQAGAVLALGSDGPIEEINPFWGIHAAVTMRRADGSPGPDGWHPEQRLSLYEALHGFTTGPAWAAGWEDDLGTLSPGKFADLLILDRDLFEIDRMDIRNARPLATMVGGRFRYATVPFDGLAS